MACSAYFLYTHDYLPRGGITLSWLGPLTSIIPKENASQACLADGDIFSVAVPCCQMTRTFVKLAKTLASIRLKGKT